MRDEQKNHSTERCELDVRVHSMSLIYFQISHHTNGPSFLYVTAQSSVVRMRGAERRRERGEGERGKRMGGGRVRGRERGRRRKRKEWKRHTFSCC